MAKKEKEKPVLTIDGKEYSSESLTDEQQTMVNHIDDLNRKIASSEFNNSWDYWGPVNFFTESFIQPGQSQL